MFPQGLCGCHGFKATAGWRFGNLIDGTQAEYVLAPDAQANLAPIPDGLTDEQVLMCPDIMSTGFKGAENASIRIGDTVVVFAQGPIGLCATAGARLLGASPSSPWTATTTAWTSPRRWGRTSPSTSRTAMWSTRS